MKRSEFIDEIGFDVSKFDWEIFKLLIGSKDFYTELDGCEYRFIKDNYIDEIYDTEVQDSIVDSYELTNLPSFIEIDWEATLDNCRQDGYGHHFATYDGEENYIYLDDEAYYYFRTN